MSKVVSKQEFTVGDEVESLPLRQILDFAKKLVLHFRFLFGSVLPMRKLQQG